MTDPVVARISHPRTGLSVKGAAPGGLTREEGVQRAQARIEAARPRLLAAMERSVRSLASLAYGADLPASAVTRTALYREASALVGVGAPLGRPALGEAAVSLCRLLDAAPPTLDARWLAAVRVHADSLVLLLERGDAMPASDIVMIQERLRHLSGSLDSQEARTLP